MSGVKNDKGKARLAIVFKHFPNALAAVAEQGWYGHDKYLEHDADFCNWKRCDGGSDRYTEAMLRHFTEEFIGDGIDTGESELPHAFATAWNALARLEKMITEEGLKELDNID